jgi:hypothetical protein
MICPTIASMIYTIATYCRNTVCMRNNMAPCEVSVDE